MKVKLHQQVEGHEPGDVVTVSKERGEFLVTNGYAVDADATGAPGAKALKSEWVDHAVAQGMDRDEADAMTKADLVKRFG